MPLSFSECQIFFYCDYIPGSGKTFIIDKVTALWELVWETGIGFSSGLERHVLIKVNSGLRRVHLWLGGLGVIRKVPSLRR